MKFDLDKVLRQEGFSVISTKFDFLNCEKGTIVPTCFMLSLIAILCKEKVRSSLLLLLW